MNRPLWSFLAPACLRRLIRSAGLGAVFAALLAMPAAQAAEATGTLTGSVSNNATRNQLEGAVVALPALNVTALTDNSGRFTLSNLPAGTHELVITYIGLDTVRERVSVGAGQRVSRDFSLTTGIYKLEAFKVTGEREGNAAMITEKRNADNVKDVIAMDSFGYLPNMSAGEVVMRLPGVAGSPTDEGLAYRFNIRGMDPSLSNVTVDGGTLTSLGNTRSFELQSITGGMFEGLELIKGQTPDKGADSLGGTINFKSRSTFSMRENSRTTYNFSTRWAPPFFAQAPIRSQHRAHPILNLTHQQVFSVFGGERNLGTSVNIFYSENAVGGFETLLNRTNLLNGPAPIFNYQTWDNANNRKQQSIALKTDYKWSPTTKFSLAVTENDNFERHRRRVRVTAATGANNTVPNATTTGVVAGAFTDKVTVVRANTVAAGTAASVPITANTLDVQMDGPLNYYVRMGRVDFTGEHTYSNFLIEYTAGVARTTLNSGNGRGGTLNMRLFDPSTQVVGRPVVFGGAGWIIDQTQDELHPRFAQNGGPDFNNPNNYLPRTTDGLVQNRNESDQFQKQFRFDTRYRTPLTAPTFLKTGFHWRSLQVDNWGKDRHRWSYVGERAYSPTQRLAHDPNYVSYDMLKTGRKIPFWQSHMFTTDGRPTDPALWQDDLYYNEQQKYVGTNRINESIGAVYLMANGRLGREGWLARTGYLGGIRFEEVKTKTFGWVRSRRVDPNAATDPIGAATRDYAGNDLTLYGGFKQKFPSIHAFHDITKDLKMRVSYSTGYGRAPLGNLLPGVTINSDTATNKMITVNNPGLKPQQAKNWDATLEYYFEPVGSLTFGWFHKDIREFIVNNQEVRIVPGGLDNGYEGEYEGFIERTSLNSGSVTVQGWEFAYSQQLTFLPGALKGLAASFNYSWTDQHGLREGTRYLTRREIAGFIPHAANASLNWRFRKVGVRALYNFTGENVTSVNLANPALSQFRYSMKTLNVGFSYQHKPTLGFTLDASNVLNEPQRWYNGYKDRMYRTTINFVTVTVGVNGRF